MGRLEGKAALITGAGSGIGAASAKLLGFAGARVAALSRSADEIAETCKAIRSAGGEAMPFTADISDSASLAKVIRAIDGTWGRLDIVLANAGLALGLQPAAETDITDWETMIATNVTGLA